MNKLNQEDKWMRYEDDIIAHYYWQLKIWLHEPERKQSDIAFTSGLGRVIARLMEDAMQRRNMGG